MASAGSAPPPSISAIQSFQPDLFTGRATTSIPIAVPPGRKGMQPSLALSYSSSGRNGWVGVGWSLDLGSIERSTKNGVPKYDASDTFTFMFQGVHSDLVSIGGNAYRAKDEGLFLKFLNNSLNGWEVWDKSGTRYTFGTDANTQIVDGGHIFRWALDSITDTNGNNLTISYTKDQNQLYPAQIRYTAHEPSGLAAANYVEFVPEVRPDVETSYRSGFAVTTVKRLKEIQTYATAQGQFQLARKYVLTYTTSARTNHSLLNSVQEFGTDGATTLPATTFTYQSSGAATYPNVLSNIVPPPSMAAWNVRNANWDTGHETWGCAHPYGSGVPWGSPTQASGAFSLGCVTGSVSGNGDVTMSGCNDHFGHVWTYVYVSQGKTISLSHSNSSDAVGCLYKEDAGGVSQITNPGSISLQAGWSILHITAYHQHQGWGPTTLSGGLKNQVNVMNPSQIALGIPQLAGDVNGDAKTDIIKFNPSNGSWSVSCATSCTLSPGGPWIPSGFGTSSSTPLLGDWNMDGRTDIAIYNSGSWQFATSTGTSFQTGTISGLSLGSGTPLTGDFNGDGLTDIGTYNNGSWSMALGTGSGFNSTSSLSWGDSNYEASTGDFNGDGLTDISLVHKSSGAIDVRLSTGTGWTTATNWIGSFGGANPHTSADFNGDGLTDAVYYNRSAGQVIYAPSTGSSFGSTITLPLTFSLTSSDDTIQVGDFNGDSIADPAVFNILSGSSQLALSSLTNADGSNSTATDALRTTANGVGGATTLTYQPSTLCGFHNDFPLPFVLHVVQKTTQEDGLGNSYSSTYLFHGGQYDAPTREFRGFNEATVFDAEGNQAITRFHQDAHKKGRPFQTEFRDAHGNTWTKTEQAWSCTEPYPGVHFATLDQVDAYTYDGDTTAKQTRSRFTYDAYGNLTFSEEIGDVSNFSDDRSTVTTYTLNESAWILNKPALIQTKDASGAVVAQRQFVYDTTGNLTGEEEWLNLPSETWLATTLGYDTYGNVTSVTDALGRTTTNTYDATGTYLTKITNALAHARQLVYDARTGQVTSSTDQNGVMTTTEYDALGRVTKVIGPNDTAALPTMRYEYDLSTVPSRVTVHARVQSGQAEELTTHTFTDGLGRTIQTRSPAEDPMKQVVTGAVEFDSLGRVVKQWVPYLSAVASSYVPLSLEPSASSLASVSYAYDATGRLLTTTDLDGSVTAASYDDWTVTSTDANGHQTRRTSDAFGRLAKAEELNDGQTYTTTYAYDALNNLAQVRDHAGNITQLVYDSLGRKLSMDDPDSGHWEYAYDDVDNLTSQTDARGVTTTFTYDALNRLTRKEYTIPQTSDLRPQTSVTYTYDNPGKPFSTGKLTEITDGSGSSSFEYDTLGRLITETKVIDGTPYTVHRAYDLLGRLVTLTYPDGDVASYTYNAQGGLETITLHTADSTQHTDIVKDVAYNAAGQITKLAYGNGVTTDYSYDPQTLRLSALSTQHTATSTVLQDFTYSFDQVGNVTQITDAVHTGTQSFQYDDLNRLTQATGAYGTLTYAYDPIGNMIEKEGATMTYGEGSAGPHAVTSALSSQQSAISMTYDASGNMLRKATDYGLPTTDFTAQQFTYDAENRLIEVKTAQEETVSVTFHPGWTFFALPVIPEDASIATLLPNFSQNFEQVARLAPSLEPTAPSRFQHYVGHPKFDDFTTLEYGVGYQVYAKREVTVTFTGKLPTTPLSRSLTSGWQLLPSLTLEPRTVNDVFGSLPADQILAYDGTLKPATTVEAGHAYYVHLMQAATFAPSLPRDPTTTFLYDGDGGRVKQLTATGTTTYLGELYEKGSDGHRTKYVFAGSQRVAAVVSSLPSQVSSLRYYHGDHLGSSNVVTDGTGQVVELAEYTPYGSLSRTEGSYDSPHKFTGQRLDNSTGLYYYHARYYDPTVGRFLQPDPFVQNLSDPQTLNRYAYVRNNPVNFVDPSGYGFLAFLVAVVAWAITIAVTADSFEEAADIRNEQKRAQEAQQRFTLPATTPLVPTIGQRWNNFATNPRVAGTASAIAGFVPGAGEMQDYWAARYGVDVFTNEQIAGGWRIAAGVALFIPLLGVVQIRQGVRALNGAIEQADELATARRSVVEAVEGAQAARKRPAIIGENMTGRVNPYASREGALTIDGWLAGREWSQALNDEFITAMKVEGRDIIDIGPDFGRRLKHRINPKDGRPPSSIYSGERQDLLNYQNYRRVYRRSGKYQGGVPGFDF